MLMWISYNPDEQEIQFLDIKIHNTEKNKQKVAERVKYHQSI